MTGTTAGWGRGWGAAELLQSLPDGVVVVDAGGVVEFVNPRAARLLGHRAEDLVGRPVNDAVPLLDGGGRSWWDVVNPWGGLMTRTGHRERMLLVPGRGQVLVTMSFLRERPLGPTVRVVVALRDTDARRRAEAENAELLSLVAHELRAPLASVKGFSTTLLHRWDRFSDTQKRLMVTTIQADAQGLARLIHELLDVSRLDTARLRLYRRRVNLTDLVGRCVERLVASGLEPDRFGVTTGWDEAPSAWADPDRLQQIVSNLLENAVQHGAGTVRVSIEGADVAGAECGSAVTATHWAVTVSDEGEGIPPEQYEVVFRKFWHGSRRGSTGLGLYLVRGLVEAHGGAITVGRSVHGGAAFRFTVPGHLPTTGCES